MAGKPDPKPAKRIVDKHAGKIKMWKEARCRACGFPGIHSRAHIVPRGEGGDDIPENMLPLCGHGTAGCHGAFDGQIEYATAPSLLVGSSTGGVAQGIALFPRELDYALNKKGEDWLRRRFAMPPMTG